MFRRVQSPRLECFYMPLHAFDWRRHKPANILIWLEWIGNEFSGRDLALAQITSRQTRPRDADLTLDSYRHRIQVPVYNIGPRIRNCRANRNGLRIFLARFTRLPKMRID